jgi:hypothetical protein
MSRVVVPNLATNWKVRVGLSVFGLAVGLFIAFVIGSPGASGIVMSGFAILISSVTLWQERSARSQASSGRVSDSN